MEKPPPLVRMLHCAVQGPHRHIGMLVRSQGILPTTRPSIRSKSGHPCDCLACGSMASGWYGTLLALAMNTQRARQWLVSLSKARLPPPETLQAPRP